MTVKAIAMWMAGCALAAGGPGKLDRKFSPDLRAWVAPDHISLAADGRAWIGGGFDGADGRVVSSLLRLGDNGGVAGEPAAGYLGKPPFVGLGFRYEQAPFLLADGGFLLPGETEGWLRMNAAGQPVGKGFPDRQPGEVITPLFESGGKFWTVRRFADGRRMLQRRWNDRRVDGGFELAATDVLGAAPGPDGGVWVLAGEEETFVLGGSSAARRVIRADAAGNVVGEPLPFSVPRGMEISAGPAGAFRLEFGPDRSRWMFWPSPTSQTARIEWYSAAGALERGQDFYLPIFAQFAWAEAADGSFVATDAKMPIAGGTQFFVGNSGNLRRFGADGTEDVAFQTPGPVRSVKALADGKWLIDGLRRLNADGSEDAAWTAPELTRPASVRALLALPGGKVLAGGDFGTADGKVRNRLVVFRRNGRVDSGFQADDRIGEWRSLAVSGNAIYVVTNEPVAYGNDVRSNLVKLGPDGALDESYEPEVPVTSWSAGARFQTVSDVQRVTALAGGAILVETSALGGDVMIYGIARLLADGSRDETFDRQVFSFRGFGQVVALKNGGFVADGAIYRRNGKLRRDLTRPGVTLRPLCEWLGGVVFLESRSGSAGRLRFWTGRRWATWFRARSFADLGNAVVATPADAGGLFVSGTWTAGRPEVRRLAMSGREDFLFHGPKLGSRERQGGRRWWKAEESGKIPFNLAAHEMPVSPSALLRHPASGSLWIGGSFNVANGQPHSGLARVAAGWDFRKFLRRAIHGKRR